MDLAKNINEYNWMYLNFLQELCKQLFFRLPQFMMEDYIVQHYSYLKITMNADNWKS